MDNATKGLKKIYNVYFSKVNKVDRDKIVEYIVKQLIAFLEDFELIGSYIQQQTAIIILDQLMNTDDEELTNSTKVKNVLNIEDYGIYFTLARFFVFIYWVALIGFEANRANPDDYNSVEKLYYLLGTMQESKGFIGICKYFNVDIKLLKPSITIDNYMEKNPLNLKSKKAQLAANKEGILINYIEMESLDIIEKPNPEVKEKVDKCLDRLKQVFMWYCSFTETDNENKMTLSKFLLFAKDAEVLMDSLNASRMEGIILLYNRK